MTKKFTYSASELFAIRDAYTPKIKKSIRNQLFKNKIWRPGSNKLNKNETVKFGVLNTRSAVHKAALIHSTIKEKCLDLFALTETWVKSDAPEAIKCDIAPQGFSVIHQHRGSYDDKRGGGIALIHKNNYKCIKLKSHSTSSIEYLTIKITNTRKPIHIIIIYRPPSSSLLTFIEEFCQLIDTELKEFNNIIICGDFNAFSHSQKLCIDERLSEKLQEYSLTQHITVSTHEKALQLAVFKLKFQPEEKKGTSLGTLLRDPYILLAAGSITIANMGVGMLEPTLPLWMFDTMHSSKMLQGAVFIPASLTYLLGTNIFGPLAFRIGRWMSAMLGMMLVALCLFAIPFSTKFEHLLLPNAGWGFAIGMVDSAMMPIMAYLVDLRHVAVYGSVYAIADVAFCVGFAVGPAVSGPIIKCISFKWLMWLMALTNAIYAPFMVLLRDPSRKGETDNLIEKKERINMGPVAYEKFGDEDEDDDVRRSNAERSEATASEIVATNGARGLPAESISK